MERGPSSCSLIEGSIAMKKSYFVIFGCFLVMRTQAQSASANRLNGEVQVVNYVDMELAKAKSGSSLLAQQVLSDERTAGCRGAFLIQEEGRPNHFILVERWRTARDLDALFNSHSYLRFRGDLQPLLASPLDTRVGQQIAP